MHQEHERKGYEIIGPAIVFYVEITCGMWGYFWVCEQDHRHKRKNTDGEERVTHFAQVIGFLWKTQLDLFVEQGFS